MSTRTASWPALIVIAFAAACGPEVPPETAASEAPPPPPAEPAAAPAAATPAAPSSGGGEEWAGEAEAKNAAPGPKGTDSAGNPTNDGKVETRTMTQIQKLVQDNRQPVRDCLDKARKDLPDLHGDMVITFVLDAEGKVKSAQLNQERSTMKAPPVVECAITVIKGLKFPPSSRGMDTTVNYPYNFAKR
jgi:hypothetical protein